MMWEDAGIRFMAYKASNPGLSYHFWRETKSYTDMDGRKAITIKIWDRIFTLFYGDLL